MLKIAVGYSKAMEKLSRKHLVGNYNGLNVQRAFPTYAGCRVVIENQP